MAEISTSIVAEINQLHELASSTARQAVGYARRAGELLLQAKKDLPHGEFGKWIAANLNISDRTVQRYMAVASGREVPMRALAGKTDTVSELHSFIGGEDLDKIVDGTWVPQWKPRAGHWYWTVTDTGAYWVVPDVQNPERFHVSRLYSEKGKGDAELFDGTRWPESADLVEARLKLFSMADPSQAQWNERKKAGLPQPFGAPKKHGMIRVVGSDGQERWLPDAS